MCLQRLERTHSLCAGRRLHGLLRTLLARALLFDSLLVRRCTANVIGKPRNELKSSPNDPKDSKTGKRRSSRRPPRKLPSSLGGLQTTITSDSLGRFRQTKDQDEACVKGYPALLNVTVWVSSNPRQKPGTCISLDQKFKISRSATVDDRSKRQRAHDFDREGSRSRPHAMATSGRCWTSYPTVMT